jgi:hypothetical protein
MHQCSRTHARLEQQPLSVRPHCRQWSLYRCTAAWCRQPHMPPTAPNRMSDLQPTAAYMLLLLLQRLAQELGVEPGRGRGTRHQAQGLGPLEAAGRRTTMEQLTEHERRLASMSTDFVMYHFKLDPCPNPNDHAAEQCLLAHPGDPHRRR